MNYRHLEIFVAVLSTGSVTLAAARLGLTQPGVSKSLKTLEAELGIRLFQRGSRGLRATDEGRALYLEAARLTDGYDHVENFARNLSKMEHARLEISCIPAISTDWMPRHVAGFLREYSEARLCFRSRSSPETVQMVASGELDLGISQARSDDSSVEKTHLLDLDAVCILPRAHRLAARDAIALSDLQGERIISLSSADNLRRELEAQLQVAGVVTSSRLEVAAGAMLARMAGYGQMIGVVDVESAQLHDPDYSVVRPFRERISVPIYLLQNALKPQTLMQRKFVDYLLAASRLERESRGLTSPPPRGWHPARNAVD